MIKKTASLTLTAILILILSACTLGSSNPDNTLIDSQTPATAVEMTVQADTAAPIDAVGQVIQYTYNIRNIGTDPLPGVVTVTGAPVTCPLINTIGNKDEFLDVGEILTCVSSYTTVQEDLDRGSITTVTTANVNGILSSEITTTVTTVPNRLLTLTKTAEPAIYDHIGQTIKYTYVVTNSGTLDIGPTQFVVTDAGISTPLNCGNADLTLAPSVTVTCSISYTVSQADMDAASIATEATVSGGGVGPSGPASATVTKSADNPNFPKGSNVSHVVQPGEWLWQIARCYGAKYDAVRRANPQLLDPNKISPDTTVTVPNVGSEGRIYGPPCVGTHTVQSGETWESIAQRYNADPIVLQVVNKNNMAVGVVLKVPLNSAGGSTVTPTKILTLTTTAEPLTYSQAGQAVTYTYVIKNSGNTTLGPAQFTVSNSLFGDSLVNCGAADTTLIPEATVTCNSVYTTTDADMNADKITNNATASGGGAGPSQPASISISKNVATLSLVTAASPQTYTTVGEVITFTYAIRNIGNTTLGPAQFTISDSLYGDAITNCGAADTSLAPDGVLTCPVTYTTTQADVDLASITSNATASGGGAASQPVNTTINKQ